MARYNLTEAPYSRDPQKETTDSYRAGWDNIWNDGVEKAEAESDEVCDDCGKVIKADVMLYYISNRQLCMSCYLDEKN